MNSTQSSREMTVSENRVETRDGCTLVFGALSLIQVRDLSRDGSRDDVMSPDLARLAGASFAYGSADAVAALLARSHAGKLSAQRPAKPAQHHPHDAAVDDLTDAVATVSIGPRADALGNRMTFTRLTEAGKQLPAGKYPLYTHFVPADDRKVHQEAARWRVVRELDGATISAILGDCDGLHPELADAAVDESVPVEIEPPAKQLAADLDDRR